MRRQRADVDGKERGGSGGEGEHEEANLHGDGGESEKAVDDGGVAIDGGVEGGVDGEWRGRDGYTAVGDVVDNLGAGWEEREEVPEGARVGGRKRGLVQLCFVPGESASEVA